MTMFAKGPYLSTIPSPNGAVMSLLEDVEAQFKLRVPVVAARRRVRESAGVTRRQIAAELGVSTATVRNWESGKADPRGDKAVAYVTLLDGLRTIVEQNAGALYPSADERQPIRVAAGWTQEATAAELGVSVVTVAAWENGRKEPGPTNVHAYGALLLELQTKPQALP